MITQNNGSFEIETFKLDANYLPARPQTPEEIEAWRLKRIADVNRKCAEFITNQERLKRIRAINAVL